MKARRYSISRFSVWRAKKEAVEEEGVGLKRALKFKTKPDVGRSSSVAVCDCCAYSKVFLVGRVESRCSVTSTAGSQEETGLSQEEREKTQAWRA